MEPDVCYIYIGKNIFCFKSSQATALITDVRQDLKKDRHGRFFLVYFSVVEALKAICRCWLELRVLILILELGVLILELILILELV